VTAATAPGDGETFALPVGLGVTIMVDFSVASNVGDAIAVGSSVATKVGTTVPVGLSTFVGCGETVTVGTRVGAIVGSGVGGSGALTTTRNATG